MLRDSELARLAQLAHTHACTLGPGRMKILFLPRKKVRLNLSFGAYRRQERSQKPTIVFVKRVSPYQIRMTLLLLSNGKTSNGK